MINDQLSASVEQVGERFFAVWSVEHVVLLDLDPGQLATLGTQLIAQPGEFFFLLKCRFRAAIHSSCDTIRLCCMMSISFQ